MRQRDGLPNSDLDRTHRQQAFLDSVMHQLGAEGVLSDLTKLQALLSAAKQYVITDAGWNLLDFASQMRDLTSGNLVFRTLPIQGYATIDGQDANVVDPATIKVIVHTAFYPKPIPACARSKDRVGAMRATVDVLNGGNTAGLAARDSAALAAAGYKAGKVGNTSSRTTTAVRYGRGASAVAKSIAKMFGVTATPSSSVIAGHVEVLLGLAATTPINVPVAAPSPSPSPSASSSSVIPSTGPQGGAVSAENGIPCVN